MIELTTISGTKFFLNPDLIYRIEQTPDTVVTLTTEKIILVQESAEQINHLIVAYRREIFAKLFEH
ncbi:MAG: flagellar FlbD family protein [Liquorilactobacillus nagelii]|jgi:flagellar protein FlbD|uniref:Endoflagellar protein n=1 Tax=Liquorilactobacillus nagelii TaxID=82688 RepID=A0A3Q8D177_9LACO|nr:flagellar FlbD family protein [Liquorilactobacillus nagelii]AUJ33045.1 endoflagellar protein [Liquorilactobacillus nagelii]MCC7616652.1 endoflagellar protein [Liquorilactobacillus nagelii]MCI1700081.1 flagellar FlbD family protein [Liquorilactobacillus nagelii]MCI1920785.1 flagellar FlbD family protein [Liquorilactobacillus nagelii]MCI1976883.1 flagellar FlbD family protein [Liquorilactobacillus nagelii]